MVILQTFIDGEIVFSGNIVETEIKLFSKLSIILMEHFANKLTTDKSYKIVKPIN